MSTRRDDIYAGGFQGHDQLDPADSLAGEIGEDPLDAGYSPPDREPLNTRWGNTLDELRRGESLAQHLAEEEPEITEAFLDETNQQPRAGRLVNDDDDEFDNLAIFTPDVFVRDVGRAGWASSAEEAAMHVIED
jgi:Family of unknown function (DUF5709)